MHSSQGFRQPIKSGYLFKENDHGLVRREWRRRFFILTRGARCGTLIYYDKEPIMQGNSTLSFPRATLDLAGASVSDTKNPRPGRHAFRLNVVTGGTQKIHKLILAGKDLEDVQDWMDAFRTVGVTVTFEARGMVETPRRRVSDAQTFFANQRSISAQQAEVASGQPLQQQAKCSSTKSRSSTRDSAPISACDHRAPFLRTSSTDGAVTTTDIGCNGFQNGSDSTGSLERPGSSSRSSNRRLSVDEDGNKLTRTRASSAPQSSGWIRCLVRLCAFTLCAVLNTMLYAHFIDDGTMHAFEASAEELYMDSVRPHMPVLNLSGVDSELVHELSMSLRLNLSEYDVELPPQVRAQLSAVEGAMQEWSTSGNGSVLTLLTNASAVDALRRVGSWTRKELKVGRLTLTERFERWLVTVRTHPDGTLAERCGDGVLLPGPSPTGAQCNIISANAHG